LLSRGKRKGKSRGKGKEKKNNGQYKNKELALVFVKKSELLIDTKDDGALKALKVGPPTSLWQEKANIELNIAILHSFQRARVSMVDHYTAAEGFMTFCDAEFAAGSGVPAEWVGNHFQNLLSIYSPYMLVTRLVPPCAGSVSPLFHLEMTNWLMKPNCYPLEFPGKDYVFPDSKSHHSNISLKGVSRLALLLTRFMKRAQDRRHRVTVLFATETGNSERYAQRTAKFLNRIAVVRVLNMENFSPKDVCRIVILWFLYIYIFSWKKKSSFYLLPLHLVVETHHPTACPSSHTWIVNHCI
jgi:Nitric oxide synthase, oxygenase domain